MINYIVTCGHIVQLFLVIVFRIIAQRQTFYASVFLRATVSGKVSVYHDYNAIDSGRGQPTVA